MTFLAPSATADSILAWWHSSSTRRSKGLMMALSAGEGRYRTGYDITLSHMQHQERLHLNSPITSLLSKLSSLAWLALRICILMNSILVLLSWSICCAVANSLRSCEHTKTQCMRRTGIETDVYAVKCEYSSTRLTPALVV